MRAITYSVYTPVHLKMLCFECSVYSWGLYSSYETNVKRFLFNVRVSRKMGKNGADGLTVKRPSVQEVTADIIGCIINSISSFIQHEEGSKPSLIWYTIIQLKHT